MNEIKIYSNDDRATSISSDIVKMKVKKKLYQKYE